MTPAITELSTLLCEFESEIILFSIFKSMDGALNYHKEIVIYFEPILFTSLLTKH